MSENRSATGREANIRKLAVLDWANLPFAAICEELDVTTQTTLSAYRNDPLYAEAVAELRSEWEREMTKLPSTLTLRKKISQGMTLGVNALIEILSGRSSNKDKIAAARLVSQLDGRFLRMGADEGENDPLNPRVESIAEELLRHLNVEKPN
jgi:hypothetical protein